MSTVGLGKGGDSGFDLDGASDEERVRVVDEGDVRDDAGSARG